MDLESAFYSLSQISTSYSNKRLINNYYHKNGGHLTLPTSSHDSSDEKTVKHPIQTFSGGQPSQGNGSSTTPPLVRHDGV